MPQLPGLLGTSSRLAGLIPRAKMPLRHVVVDEDLAEIQVHPPEAFPKLVETCLSSARDLLSQREQFVETDCPACASPRRELAFEKYGYSYWNCEDCATLFISPRPPERLAEWYSFHSPAALYRSSEEYLRVMGPRLKELAAYRSAWIAELCAHEDRRSSGTVVDVETYDPEYLVELAKRNIQVISASPVAILRDPQSKTTGRATKVADLSDIPPASIRLVTLFDVLEHQSDIVELLRKVHGALEPEGLLVISTRSSSGLDIQALWENATVFPLEHVNLVSLEGITQLLVRTGFEIVEQSTPGLLDVQMIDRVSNSDRRADVPRFLRYFFQYRDQNAKHRLQQFLQENLLSSHLRVVARKTKSIS